MMFFRLFKTSLTVSLLLHFGLSIYLLVNEERVPQPKEYIEVTIQDPSVTVPDSLPKQVVQQNDKPMNDEADKKAKFLGQFNQRVVEEKRAQQHGDFTNQTGLQDREETKKQTAQKKSKLKQALSADKKLLNGVPVMEAL